MTVLCEFSEGRVVADFDPKPGDFVRLQKSDRTLTVSMDGNGIEYAWPERDTFVAAKLAWRYWESYSVRRR